MKLTKTEEGVAQMAPFEPTPVVDTNVGAELPTVLDNGAVEGYNIHEQTMDEQPMYDASQEPSPDIDELAVIHEQFKRDMREGARSDAETETRRGTDDELGTYARGQTGNGRDAAKAAQEGRGNRIETQKWLCCNGDLLHETHTFGGVEFNSVPDHATQKEKPTDVGFSFCSPLVTRSRIELLLPP